jgi:hypothetical protein
MGEEFNIPILEKGKYQHYKGNVYEVLGVGCHTESNEYYVVYQASEPKPGTPEIWVRPYEMFVENVEVNGVLIPRFKKI